MKLEQITPVILTFNEHENIGRTLDRLDWAVDAVVVDSFSTDETVELVKKHRNVRLFSRKFDGHSEQWNFAIQETQISSEWILALDADYVLTDEFLKELMELQPETNVDGYLAGFTYCVWGKPLRGNLYPPVSVLYRKAKAHYVQDGHTQRVIIQGAIGKLRSKILHDDRKPLSRWLQAQDRYTQLEAAHISNLDISKMGGADRIRRAVPLLVPPLVFLYCYFWKGGWLSGGPGLYYSMQRMLAEALLILRLLERRSCDRIIKCEDKL